MIHQKVRGARRVNNKQQATVKKYIIERVPQSLNSHNQGGLFVVSVACPRKNNQAVLIDGSVTYIFAPMSYRPIPVGANLVFARHGRTAIPVGANLVFARHGRTAIPVGANLVFARLRVCIDGCGICVRPPWSHGDTQCGRTLCSPACGYVLMGAASVFARHGRMAIPNVGEHEVRPYPL